MKPQLIEVEHEQPSEESLALFEEIVGKKLIEEDPTPDVPICAKSYENKMM